MTLSHSAEEQLPETVAAVDLGSNSFHMIVARFDNGHLQVIDRLREMVRLGEGLQPDKTLSEDVWYRALACLERFGQRLRSLPQGAVRAVGTNTLRQLRDEAFLSAARDALGHPIEVIAGREEARLIYLGVAHGLETGDGRRLVVDIGGGSTEIIIGRGFEPIKRESLHMGCVSYSRQFFPDGVISEAAMNRAVLSGRLAIRPVHHSFEAGNWKAAVGSSGTVRSIRKVVQNMGWSEQGITRSALKRLRKALVEAGHVDKIEFEGLNPERRPVFAGGVAVLSAVFKALDIESMSVSDLALREGLLYEMVGQLRHEDVRENTVKAMQERYGVDTDQARRVEATATGLLRQATGPWSLSEEESLEVLSWAARLHETGLLISHSQFHKHGAYIIANADLPGFTRQQQRILAALVRSHRRKIPSDVFDALPEGIRQVAKQLTVLLRLAVLMHRGRSHAGKPLLHLQVEGEKIQVRFPPGWLEDHPLTQMEMEEEAKYLAGLGFELGFS